LLVLEVELGDCRARNRAVIAVRRRRPSRRDGQVVGVVIVVVGASVRGMLGSARNGLDGCLGRMLALAELLLLLLLPARRA